MLHIKTGSKSNTNSQLQSQFYQEFELFSKNKINANNGGHYYTIRLSAYFKKH